MFVACGYRGRLDARWVGALGRRMSQALAQEELLKLREELAQMRDAEAVWSCQYRGSGHGYGHGSTSAYFFGRYTGYLEKNMFIKWALVKSCAPSVFEHV